MSILLGIAILFGIMFAMFSGAAGHEFSGASRPRLTLNSRPDPARPDTHRQLLLEGSGFEPDSQLRFVAWHWPDGHGHFHREPVESARPYAYRSSSFDDVPFEPSVPLQPFTGEGSPHDIKVIATDNHGHAAEAWISGQDFYLATKSQVAA